MTLSVPQLRALKQVRSRRLFTADINSGNERRTYASLFKLGLIDWDPIWQSVVLTATGKETLQSADKKRAEERSKLGRIGRPLLATNEEPVQRWNGMCPAGKHGLDFQGQPCDRCAEIRS